MSNLDLTKRIQNRCLFSLKSQNHRLNGRRQRRYAIVLVFIVAAILTPPDIFSMLALAVPALGLYEISIYSVRMIEKSQAKPQSQAP